MPKVLLIVQALNLRAYQLSGDWGNEVAEILKERWDLRRSLTLFPEEKDSFDPKTPSMEERNDSIKEHPAYGNIICRCETISEGEIIDAIGSAGSKIIRWYKKKNKSGNGRCQSGFCSPKTMEILARERGINIEEITKIRREDPRLL